MAQCCIYCGKVGARIQQVGRRWSHRRCIPKILKRRASMNDERVVLEVRADGSLRTMSKKQTAAWRKNIKSKINEAGAR